MSECFEDGMKQHQKTWWANALDHAGKKSGDELRTGPGLYSEWSESGYEKNKQKKKRGKNTRILTDLLEEL